MVKIRKATLQDLEGILALSKELFEYETQFNNEFDQEWTYSEVGMDYFRNRLVNKDSIVLVAEENVKIVGYILVHIQSFTFRKRNFLAEIENMCVREMDRNKGIGARLVLEAKKRLKNRKITRLKVQTFYPNKKAIKFYKKLGFSDFVSELEMDL